MDISMVSSKAKSFQIMKYSLALIYLRHPLTLMCQHSTKDKTKRFQESNIIMLIQKILKKRTVG